MILGCAVGFQRAVGGSRPLVAIANAIKPRIEVLNPFAIPNITNHIDALKHDLHLKALLFARASSAPTPRTTRHNLAYFLRLNLALHCCAGITLNQPLVQNYLSLTITSRCSPARPDTPNHLPSVIYQHHN